MGSQKDVVLSFPIISPYVTSRAVIVVRALPGGVIRNDWRSPHDEFYLSGHLVVQTDDHFTFVYSRVSFLDLLDLWESKNQYDSLTPYTKSSL
jgi:hypothetical protein